MYCNLKVDCEGNGWSCCNLAVEIGAIVLVGECLRRAASMIGMKGIIIQLLLRDAGKDWEAAHCSRWIYVLYRKLKLESRDESAVSVGSAIGP